ncbi:MAG: hypothetical protein Q8M17_10880 [Actinomycetota bacterium]|nr:hypothetical protein [Actinomycetota bacterium]
MTALFVGVVSHQGSRFSVSQGPDGLAARLAEALRGHGVDCTVVVCTEDLLDESRFQLTEAMVQSSLSEQLRLDRRWTAFLRRPQGPGWWAHHAARWGRRSTQRVRSPGPGMVRRLLNIELAHLRLLGEGARSAADWVLILEDDAGCTDVADAAAGLAGIIQAPGAQPEFVNVSQSFSLAQLGIVHLLTPADGHWAGTQDRSLLQSAVPVTNTVCAIAYRAAFAGRLLEVMEALPLEPVVPIDWKLNLALMAMADSGELTAGDCWLVDPAPIDQLSMQPQG